MPPATAFRLPLWTPPRWTLPLWTLLLLCPAASCGAIRPNVLLIVSEDNGPELGCYGDPYARTPHLDRLAEQGVRFERAFVPYSVCSPSRAAFLTGLYPHQNGQIGLATHHFSLYRNDLPNAATLMKSAGYRTGLIGKLHVNPAQAFPFDDRAIPSANFGRRKMEEYAAAAAKFIRSSDKPFFLSINYPDAHLPFHRQQFGRPAQPVTGKDVKPLPWVGIDSPRLRSVTADYYNCLARLDEGIGLLLDELRDAGKFDNTLIMYFGDHGAQFPRGKVSLYEGGLRIPLIVHWPGQTAQGLVRQDLVSTVDILPTMLAAAGVAIPENLPGRSLVPLLRGESVPWRDYIFAFGTGSFPLAFCLQHSVRDERYKLILNLRPDVENLGARPYLDPDYPVTVVSGFTLDEQASASPGVAAALERYRHPPAIELYDLQTDPHEWTNLAGQPEYAAVQGRLEAALREFRTQTRDPFLDPANVESFAESQLGIQDMSYRRNKNFRWPYVDAFREWRDQREAAVVPDPAPKKQ